MGRPQEISRSVEDDRAQRVGVESDQSEDLPGLEYAVRQFQLIRWRTEFDLSADGREVVERQLAGRRVLVV
ncbi:hypothetical protein [Mycolicibacterium austroafricanum]|uniref:hypothetical protein n=1 Tax=Mycolicibacterium austroafricanum TaxID=39687 RepID=UPI001CA3108B|nr:hypothetical protein [Mycolicibacterium austroafricanum]QZT62305.1 hypothetical protein JN085_26025 [Mycolicibacterium austroafricanum]